METLIVHLLLSRYLKEAFSSTAYTVNVYVEPGELALRLVRFPRADILAGKGPRVHCSFRRHKQRRSSATDATAGRKRKQSATSKTEARGQPPAGPSLLPYLAETSAKRKRVYGYVDAEEEEEIDELADDMEDLEQVSRPVRVADDKMGRAGSMEESSEDGDGGEWEYSLRPSVGPWKKQRVSLLAKDNWDVDADVISLSD